MMLLDTVFARPEYAALRTARPAYLLDIGANIGAVTLDQIWNGNAKQVDAYEPNPITCEVLERNIRANGLASSVRVYREAVGGREGSVPLWAGGESVLSSTAARSSLSGEPVYVDAVTLDTAVARTRSTTLVVKIDAEGAEVEMLEAASRCTLEAIQLLVMEYHDSLVPRARDRCLSVLRGAGFVCAIRPFTADQGLLIARRQRSG
jgi:FkbM family methyltransferase